MPHIHLYGVIPVTGTTFIFFSLSAKDTEAHHSEDVHTDT